MSDYQSLYSDVNAPLSRNQQLNPSEHAASEAATHLFDEVTSLVAELEDLEVTPSTKKLKTGLSAARQTFRTHRKAGDLEARQRRINESTNILGTKLLLMLNKRSESKLDHLKSALKAEDIRDGDGVRKLHNVVFKLIKSQEQHAIKERSEAIRHSLLFESMDYWRNIISEQHRKTFEWGFQRDSSPLLDWLETGNNIFWICGKAGSGKSTFMKFLGHHENTSAALIKWAGPYQLVIVEHFFYYAGSHMQKSHQGLLQSLLSQVLLAGSSRNLASILCSKRWSKGDGEVSRPWSRNEVMKSLLSLRELDDMKFCFFIDGLDEYHPHTEHDRLIADLTELASVPNVKICTSSRPSTKFVEAFGSSAKQLRLECLTRHDIAQYTKENLAAARPSVGRLAAVYTPQILHELGVNVTNKAQGVFLWVYLVLSALKERLKARSNIAKLLECVEEFPAELEEYFRSCIYDRIHLTLRNDTVQSLKLAWLILQHVDEHSTLLDAEQSSTAALQGCPSRDCAAKPSALASKLTALRSFLPFWVLRVGMLKPKFAITMELSIYPRSDMDDMITVVRHYLSACCKDLLWIPSPQRDDDYYWSPHRDVEYEPHYYKGEFLRRTVYDFRGSTEMTELFDKNIPQNFHDKTFLLDVTVACLKNMIEKPSGKESDRCEEFFDAACGIAHIAQPGDHSSTSQSIALKALDCLGAQYLELYCAATAWESCLGEKSLCCRFEFLISHQLHTYTESCLRNSIWTLPEEIAPRMPYLHPLLTITKPTGPPPSRAFAVLLASLGLRGTRIFPGKQMDEELVRMFLQHSFSPNMIVPRTTENEALSSVWTVFLQAWLKSRTVDESSALYVENHNDEADLKFWQLAKLMIAYSADLTHSF